MRKFVSECRQPIEASTVDGRLFHAMAAAAGKAQSPVLNTEST